MYRWYRWWVVQEWQCHQWVYRRSRQYQCPLSSSRFHLQKYWHSVFITGILLAGKKLSVACSKIWFQKQLSAYKSSPDQLIWCDLWVEKNTVTLNTQPSLSLWQDYTDIMCTQLLDTQAASQQYYTVGIDWLNNSDPICLRASQSRSLWTTKNQQEEAAIDFYLRGLLADSSKFWLIWRATRCIWYDIKMPDDDWT